MESPSCSSSLFEHDLRANAFRVCREGKPVSTFPDHALSAPAGPETAPAAGLRLWRADLLGELVDRRVIVDSGIVGCPYQRDHGGHHGARRLAEIGARAKQRCWRRLRRRFAL